MAAASELTLSRSALQSIVSTSLFNDRGKWYLDKGACYAFLERPRISLAKDRVVIAAHFASRAGIAVSGSCVGADLSSNVSLSGRLLGAGSKITLADIRIDKVDDELSRNALELLQFATGEVLPRTLTIDVLPLLEPENVSATGVRVEVSGLKITSVLTRADSVLVTFEVSLNAQ